MIVPHTIVYDAPCPDPQGGARLRLLVRPGHADRLEKERQWIIIVRVFP